MRRTLRRFGGEAKAGLHRKTRPARDWRGLECGIVPALRIAAVATVFFVAAAGGAAAQTPYDQLRVVAPAAPGGGWDQTARVMQQVLQQARLVRTVSVENIPGAAGTIGLARFLGAERGRDDAVLVSGLIMLGGIVTHRSPVALRDVTPLARLTGEYEVVVVPDGSRFRTLADVLAALRERPESVAWGGGSAGGSDHILAGLIADAAGVEPARLNYIAFSGGGESLAAIVGGQVAVGVNGLAELAAQIEAGTVRVLAISSAERLPGVDAPTLREQGIDVVFENWRSVLAPAGITAEQRARLGRVIAAMAASAEWREALARYRWIDRYLGGPEFERFVADEEARVAGILRELGTGGDDTRSTMAYPGFVLAGLLLCGIASYVLAPAVATPVVRAPWRPLALVVVGIAAQFLLAGRAGFIVALAVLFWCTARAFDARRPVRDAVVAVMLAVAAFVLFDRALDLSLPSGIVEAAIPRW